ncbi:MAG: hypothetical protein WCK57_00615 [Verrucomicrobiae bacterium]
MNPVLQAIIATWSSRKLWVTLIAAGILWGSYHITVHWLYYYASGDPKALPNAKEAITALTSMYSVMFYGLTGIVAAYVGANSLVQMRQGSMVQTALSSLTENIKEETVERTPRPRDFTLPEDE